ncbi:MAG: S1/P1 nuclease [Robiginitalea sp.]|jgi:hypothetical protein
MKRIDYTCLLLLFLLILPGLYGSAPPWGKTGHRVVGEVAQKYLKGKARKAIKELLGGESLAEVANYADAIKSDPKFRSYSPWHYVNFPFEADYEEVSPSSQGDIIKGIERSIAVLKDPATEREEKVFYLKMLIHFVGDLHQPMHVGRAEDRGGNDIQLQWFGRGTNLHRVWDSQMIDDYGMSYTELARSLPRWTREKKEQVQKGSVRDWVREIRPLTIQVYESVQSGEKLSYPYSYRWWDTVEEQLLIGGLRLAAVLNTIYG